MATEWRHWNHWRSTCSLAACDTETQEALRQFAFMRWRRYAAVCARHVFPGAAFALPVNAADTWHDFESVASHRNF